MVEFDLAVLAAVFAACITWSIIQTHKANARVHRIPAIGPSSSFLPVFFSAYRLLFHSRELLFQGYKKVCDYHFIHKKSRLHMHSTMDLRSDLQP